MFGKKLSEATSKFWPVIILSGETTVGIWTVALTVEKEAPESLYLPNQSAIRSFYSSTTWRLSEHRAQLRRVSLGDEEDKNAEDEDEGEGFGGRRKVKKLRLFISNLNSSNFLHALKKYCSLNDDVTDKDVSLEGVNGKPRRTAFANMTTPQRVKDVL
uniref:RRM domain-containing protein n=1 Tax=Echinococcus granulosus TaxID=6210 RepID=A0A068W6Z6_ECHGR|nr:hypothetical protein EgrG_002015000 [Echinococcus granulosus]